MQRRLGSLRSLAAGRGNHSVRPRGEGALPPLARPGPAPALGPARSVPACRYRAKPGLRRSHCGHSRAAARPFRPRRHPSPTLRNLPWDALNAISRGISGAGARRCHRPLWPQFRGRAGNGGRGSGGGAGDAVPRGLRQSHPALVSRLGNGGDWRRLLEGGDQVLKAGPVVVV